MKKVRYILAVLLIIQSILFIRVVPCLADSDAGYDTEYEDYSDEDYYNYYRVDDSAGLLSEDEFTELDNILYDISTGYQMDVLIVTQDGLDGKNIVAAADDYYDYYEYGYGEDHDGILFMIDMDSRTWAISTTGRGIPVFTDSVQENMTSRMLPDLKDGNYYNAFRTFAFSCEDRLRSWNEDSEAGYSESSESSGLSGSAGIIVYYVVPLVIGAVLAGFVVFFFLRQLKSVHMRYAAGEYIVKNSLRLSKRSDLFLYSKVTKVPKPEEKKRGGGGSDWSSTHTSSSGTTHGGSSGSF